jgi:hypothetical protein
VDEDFTGTDDAETGALGMFAGLEGSLPASELAGLRASMSESQRLAREQRAFYDRVAEETRKRRVGPSTSEQLFELSAALARPTTVRGFSGVLNNVMPVLQQQAKATRVGEEGRTEALNAMQLAQLRGAQGLANQDVTTRLSVARLMAAAGKSNAPKYDPIPGGPGYQQRPGTGGAPEFPQQDEFGNYVLTDPRQVNFLPINSRMIVAGGDPTKPKYKPAS